MINAVSRESRQATVSRNNVVTPKNVFGNVLRDCFFFLEIAVNLQVNVTFVV